MLYCKECNQVITNKYYKYLWINKRKTDITICQECYIMWYMLKPEQFKINNSKIYKDAYHKLHYGAGA
jgi:hypothetical protein